MGPHPVSNSLIAIISDIINIKISLLYMITIGVLGYPMFRRTIFMDHGAMVEHEKTADVGVWCVRAAHHES